MWFFASPCSQASDPMESRDKKQHALLDQIGVAGSTQGEAYHVFTYLINT